MNTKEVAKELGISKQAVVKKFDKYFDDLQPFLKMNDDGQYELDPDGLDMVRQVGQRKRIKQDSPVDKIVKAKNLEIFELEKKIGELTKKIVELETENEKLRDRNDVLFNKNDEMSNQIIELSNRIADLAADNNKGFFRRLLGNRK